MFRSRAPSPHRTIEPLFQRPPTARDTQFQRRRLGLLVAVLCAVLALAPLVSRLTADDSDGDVVAAYASAPVTLSNVIAETSATIHAAQTTDPSTTTPSTTTTTTPTTTVAPTSTTPPTTAATTTAPPTTAPPTTAPPAPPPTAAPTTTAAPPPTAAPTTSSQPERAYSDPRSTQVWHDLADCESHGNWSINTGNGYYGGLQFSLGSWRNVGGTGYPHEHSAATQIEMGRRLQAVQGWAAWPHCSAELGLR